MVLKRFVFVASIISVISLGLIGCSPQTSTEEVGTTKQENISSQEDTTKEYTNTEISVESLDENIKNICKYIRSFKFDDRDKSLAYITKKYKEYGYEPIIEEFDIYDLRFDTSISVDSAEIFFAKHPNNEKLLGQGKNIVINHPNNKAGRKTLYLTAHYDTNDYTVGVMDNGTGTVVVMELAKALRNYGGNLNLVFVLFDSEEILLQGSKEFVGNMTLAQKENAIGCLNVDMVGEIDAGKFKIMCDRGEYDVLSVMLNNSVEEPMKVIMGGLTDDLPFRRAKIPAITLSDYNSNFSLDKEENQFQYIKIEELKHAAELIHNFILTFDEQYYQNILDNRIQTKTNLLRNQIYHIDHARFQTANAVSVGNGYSFDTELIYKYKEQSQLKVTYSICWYYLDLDYSDFESIVMEDTEPLRYKYIEGDAGSNQMVYCSASHYGVVSGNFSRKELLEILLSFNDSERNFRFIE